MLQTIFDRTSRLEGFDAIPQLTSSVNSFDNRTFEFEEQDPEEGDR